MKIVLKRRKHRKGIRPKRKGTLKVRQVTLPTKDEHSDRIGELLSIISKAIRDPKYKLHLEMTYGEMWAHQRHGAMMNVILDKIKLMQRGYDFFRDFKQIQLVELAEPAVSEYDPLYSKIETPCDTCVMKRHGLCLGASCSILSSAALPQVKTTDEMAQQALTHLS